MALLTVAKVYGLTNTPSNRQLAKEMAEWIFSGIQEKMGSRSVFSSQILFDERCAERPGFRLKVACRSSNALAKALDLPLAEGRRGRTAGGRDAFVIDLRGQRRPRAAAATQTANALAGVTAEPVAVTVELPVTPTLVPSIMTQAATVESPVLAAVAEPTAG